MRSAGGTGTIGRVTAGDGDDESAPPGVSADTGRSGRGIIDTARDARAKPAGTAIQPAHPAAGTMRRRNCWSRYLGRRSAGGGGASPCHNHRPASLISVLTNRAEGATGGVPITIGALLYVLPKTSPGSACTAHIPLLVAANSRVPRATPRTGSGPHRFRSRPNSSFGEWPWRSDGLPERQIGDQSNHRIEVRRRPRVIFMAERHIRPLPPDLRGKEVAK